MSRIRRRPKEYRFPVACAFLHIPTNFHIEQKRSGSFRLRFFDILQKVVVLDNLWKNLPGDPSIAGEVSLRCGQEVPGAVREWQAVCSAARGAGNGSVRFWSAGAREWRAVCARARAFGKARVLLRAQGDSRLLRNDGGFWNTRLAWEWGGEVLERGGSGMAGGVRQGAGVRESKGAVAGAGRTRGCSGMMGVLEHEGAGDIRRPAAKPGGRLSGSR